MAFSFASAPPFVKKKTSMSPGAISASFAPRRARGSVAMNGFAYGQRRRLLLDRLDDTRSSPWPMLTHINWLLKSRNRLSFGRPEVRALRAGHRNRVDCVLRGPFEEGVLPGQLDDLLTGERWRDRGFRHEFANITSLMQSCQRMQPLLMASRRRARLRRATREIHGA